MRRLFALFSGLARSLLSRSLADFIMNTAGCSFWQGQPCRNLILNQTERHARERFQPPLEIGQLVVEFDLHAHGAERLDAVRLVGEHEAWPSGLKDGFGGDRLGRRV